MVQYELTVLYIHCVLITTTVYLDFLWIIFILHTHPFFLHMTMLGGIQGTWPTSPRKLLSRHNMVFLKITAGNNSIQILRLSGIQTVWESCEKWLKIVHCGMQTSMYENRVYNWSMKNMFKKLYCQFLLWIHAGIISSKLMHKIHSLCIIWDNLSIHLTSLIQVHAHALQTLFLYYQWL